jgi:hypothetical protein
MIRTCDPLIRSQILYPAELRVQKRRIIKLPALPFYVKEQGLSPCYKLLILQGVVK